MLTKVGVTQSHWACLGAARGSFGGPGAVYSKASSCSTALRSAVRL